jgi:hypothetical protein
MVFNAHLCNHVKLQSGGGTWATTLYTVRGVVSGSRDVDSCHTNGLYTEDRRFCLVPVTLEHCNIWGLNVATHCPTSHRTSLPLYRDSTVSQSILDSHVLVYPSGPH